MQITNSKTALFCAAFLLSIDVYLFKAGLSWTPLHYESFLPLLVMSCKQGRPQIYAAIASTLLLGILAVLYFAFGLTYLLASESRSFLALATVATLIFIYPLVQNIFNARQLPIFFMAIVLFFLVIDKTLMRDMLSSSYFPHFFKIGEHTLTSPSLNPVYEQLKNKLSYENGGILVVYESLGVAKNRDALNNIINRYPDFNFTTLKHEGGSTVPAEIRYLCGVNGSIDDFANCIPRKIISTSMHGNSLQYFNRHILYRDMGFNKISGRYELEGLSICNFSYLAVCDDALKLKMIQEIDENQCKTFNYLLTIDSHFPYSKYSNHVDGLYDDLSGWLDAMRIVIKKYPNCNIFIVGDHPPPISHNFNSGEILLIKNNK